MANPLSLILSAEILLRHLDWHEAADNIISGLYKTILSAQVKCDLAEMVGVKLLSCSEYAAAVIQKM